MVARILRRILTLRLENEKQRSKENCTTTSSFDSNRFDVRFETQILVKLYTQVANSINTTSCKCVNDIFLNYENIVYYSYFKTRSLETVADLGFGVWGGGGGENFKGAPNLLILSNNCNSSNTSNRINNLNNELRMFIRK